MPDLQYSPISISSTGSNVIIAGSNSLTTIQVAGLYFQCGATTNFTIKAGSSALTGSMSFTIGGGLVLPNNGNIYFQCNSGDDFIFNLTGLTGQVGGFVMYYQF